jgi:tellurite resistance protein TerA
MADAPVSLSKVSLTKRGETVSLDKRSQGFGDIEINLNWAQSTPPQKSGGGLLSLFRRPAQPDAVDLDLGCLFEMQDGQKGVVQALGKTFGDLRSPPYVMLDGDDRTGANAAGETIRVNGREWSKLKRILVFAFIYEGVANWRETDGVVTVRVPGSGPIEVRMTDDGSNQRLCAICLIENENGQMKVTRRVDYHADQSTLDRAYRWGMKWRAGSKD